jgi:GNAT superfamily N-acetyltransferase
MTSGTHDRAITVRMMEPNDAVGVAELCAALGYPTTTGHVSERVAMLTASARDVLLVADDGTTVVGWVHGFVSMLLETDVFVEIGGLVVAESMQRRGVGRLLMIAIEQWAVGRGCQHVRLRSNVVREGAHRFYESLGYRQMKTQYTFAKELPEEQTAGPS